MDSDSQNKRTDEPGNITQLLGLHVQETPDKAFLFSEADGRQFTYVEFDGVVDATARLLSSHGIAKGDDVSLLMPNCAEYIIAYFACWKLGALAGPVNSLLKEQETAFVLNNSETKAILVNSEFQERIDSIRNDLPDLKSVITFDDEAKATREFSETDERGRSARAPSLCKDDDAIIIYTSGTTGKPKGCLLSHGNLIANARQIVSWLGFGPEDRLLSVMPLFHMNAVSVTTMSALYAGASTVVSPKFSASRFWQIISDYRITSFG